MKTLMNEASGKIGAEHLDRAAYVYVRQSSFYQVENNLESKRRQYDLVKWALELGWPRERIVVVDEDQGKSGASAHTRPGFARLITAVGRGEVGIVMSLEASRLARNSPDWHSLLYMCRFTSTLIADEHGIYDSASSTDRMVLGIRGQMSEMELDMSIHRMVEGRWNKARRGEYLIYPPAGYELNDLNQIVMSSDEAVVSALRTFFKKFDELQSAKRLFTWWLDEGLKFPVRRLHLRSRPVVWTNPAYRGFLYVLHNPIYAGAYAFGRTQSVRELDPDDPRKVRVRQVKRDEWAVLIKDHHARYLSYEKFEQNQARIASNQQMKRCDQEGHRGPAREGWALLQGLARCGQCGRKMTVSYGGSRPSLSSTRTLQYRCLQAQRVKGGKECQLVGGTRINDVVVDAFLEVTRHAGEEAAALACDQLERENEATERTWELQIEKAQYEAQRAERQFNAVEPENRVVARTLETRWNVCLMEVENLRAKAQAGRSQRQPLSELEKARAKRLGNDLEAVWHAATTTNQDRKQLLRAAIEEVQLYSEETIYKITIIWKGGATSEREVVRFRRGGSAFATPQDTIEMVRKLAVEFDDAQISRVLNKQGHRTGRDNPFTAHKVSQLRNRAGIPNCPERAAQDPREGPFSADEAAAQLDVCSSTIHRWLRTGLLPGKQIAPSAPWRIVLTEELRTKLKHGDAPEGWVGLSEAAKQLGLPTPQVAYLVKTGKLEAVRVVVAGRSCWRIDVNSATCGRQAKLFDQMNTPLCEEA